jgi:hypothetical protein
MQFSHLVQDFLFKDYVFWKEDDPFQQNQVINLRISNSLFLNAAKLVRTHLKELII